MKKLVYLTFIGLLFLSSCSKDEQSEPNPIPKFTIVINSGEGGSVNNQGGSYNQGSKVSVTATPDSEYVFDKWSDGNTENPREITVNADLSITAVFIKKKYNVNITIKGEGVVEQEVLMSGTISANEYNSGTILRLTATPDLEKGWVFSGWTGDIQSTNTTIEIDLSKSKEIQVEFVRDIDYNLPSIYYKNSDFWVDFFEIAGKNDGYHTGSAFADFNDDGYEDLFLAYGNNTATRFPVEIFLNQGDNKTFSPSNIAINNNEGTDAARKSIVGDFNSDGKPDVFIADHGSEIPGVSYEFAYPSILMSSSNESYDFIILENLPKAFYHGATSGDFDNDGDLDIFTSTKMMLINDGNGNFSENYNLFQDESNGIFTVEFFDFNKDGNLDLICGGHSMSEKWGEIPSSRIYYGNGVDYTVDRSVLLPNLDEWEVTVDYEIADLNNDDVEEILLVRTGGYVNENDEMVNFYNGWRIQVLEKQGDGYIDNTSQFMNDYYGTSQWLIRLRVQDIDRDGKLEIFENEKSNYQSYKPRFWKQNSNSFFEKVDVDSSNY